MPKPDDTHRPAPPLVRRNDWRPLDALPAGEPSTAVSVVIPAHGADLTLPFTLAGLAHQSWPAHLLEVVVADDGSEPPVTLPDVRPERTRVVRVDPARGWGRSLACAVGAEAAEGEALLFLDADMLVPHDHVASHALWQQRSVEAVTLGHKRFVADWTGLTLDAAVAAASARTVDTLFADRGTTAHWIEEIFDETDRLIEANHRVYGVVVGASLGLHRDLLADAGGYDTRLHRGEDTELGYRLVQAGGVLVPSTVATAWHLGPPTVETRGEEARRYNRPYFAQRVAQSTRPRTVPGRVWEVPRVHAVVHAEGVAFELVQHCVDRLLGGDDTDLVVTLVGPWDRLDDGRRSPLDDPDRDHQMVREWYRSDPRVRLATSAPDDVFPAPFRLDLPVTAGSGPSTVRRLVSTADKNRAGLVQVLVPGHDDATVQLTRTAAVRRARRHRAADAGRPDAALLDAVWGIRWVDGDELGLVDLSAPGALDELPSWSRDGARMQKRLDKAQADVRRLQRAERQHVKPTPGSFPRRVARRVRGDRP